MPNEDAIALVAAVRVGDTVAVERLLADGVSADATDPDGNTVLGLAAGGADARMCELLLDHGACVDRPSAGGLTPLMLAADAGALAAWHELRGGSPELWLRDEQGRDVKDIVEAWVGADPVAVLCARLGVGVDDDVVVERRREENEFGQWVEVVEVARVSPPGGRAVTRTGHASILTELEVLLGIRAPFSELTARGLAFDDQDHDGRLSASWALGRRVDQETFDLASELLSTSPEVARRVFAGEVLLLFGVYDDVPDAERLAGETVEVLRRRSVEEQDPQVLERIVRGLGLHFQPRSLPEILLHAAHPDPELRRTVAAALHQMVPPGHADAVNTLLVLAGDEDAQVRRAAATALSDLDLDTPTLRGTLARLLSDADPAVALEAARGRGLRDDPRADVPLMRAHLSIPPGERRGLGRAYDVLRTWPMERYHRVHDAVA